MTHVDNTPADHPTMIQRVAQAMLKRLMEPKRPRVTDKDGWLDLAEAAIEEMRQPTPAMKEAGMWRIPEAGYDLAHDAYTAMIDEALKQGAP